MPQTFRGSSTREIDLEAERLEAERVQREQDKENTAVNTEDTGTQQAPVPEAPAPEAPAPEAPAPEVPAPQAPANPPPEMLESAAGSIEAMLMPLPLPAYVKDAAQAFVDSLKKWAGEIRG